MWFKYGLKAQKLLAQGYGTKLAKLEQMKKYIDGKEYYKYRCTCHR